MPEITKGSDFFAGPQPPERIIAAEAEDDVRRAGGGYSHILPRLVIDATTARSAGISGFISKKWAEVWLVNGSRLYVDGFRDEVDHVSKLEYCTPELLGPKRFIGAVRASEEVIPKLVQAIPGQLDLHVMRRGGIANSKGQTVTSAFHLNLSVTKEMVEDPRALILETHFATQVYAWAGMVGPEGYLLSQKASGIGKGIRYDKTVEGNATRIGGQKPMALLLGHGQDEDINGRDSPFGRLEDRTKERSTDWGTFMAAATTSLLLRVLEHPEFTDLNERLQALALVDPVAVLHSASKDLSLRQTYELQNGRKMTAIQIQSQMAQVVRELAGRIRLPADEQWAIDQWIEICLDLETVARTRQTEIVANRIGWAMRKLILNRAGQTDLQSSNLKALRICMGTDQLTPLDPRYNRRRIEEKIGISIVTNQEVAPFVDQLPPKGTRSRLRAEHLANPDFTPKTIQWNNLTGELRLGSGKYAHTTCSFEPYAVSHQCDTRKTFIKDSG